MISDLSSEIFLASTKMLFSAKWAYILLQCPMILTLLQQCQCVSLFFLNLSHIRSFLH